MTFRWLTKYYDSIIRSYRRGFRVQETLGVATFLKDIDIPVGLKKKTTNSLQFHDPQGGLVEQRYITVRKGSETEERLSLELEYTTVYV